MKKALSFFANLFCSLNLKKANVEASWKVENLDTSEFEKINYKRDEYSGHFKFHESTVIAYDTDGKCCFAPLKFLPISSLWAANFKYDENTPLPPGKVKKFHDPYIWTFQRAYDFIQIQNMKLNCFSFL
ncbi:MAG: hypothetical protein Q8Q23_02715 [bacterium]|nr:hypothetical protein [bacterium]